MIEDRSNTDKLIISYRTGNYVEAVSPSVRGDEEIP
jgi:hypothetical protein